MPRLPPSLIRHAARLHPLLPPLLRECRDLDSARNELRWLKEFAEERQESKSKSRSSSVRHNVPSNLTTHIAGQDVTASPSAATRRAEAASRPEQITQHGVLNLNLNPEPKNSGSLRSAVPAAGSGSCPGPRNYSRSGRRSRSHICTHACIHDSGHAINSDSNGNKTRLIEYVRRRARGEPLQYILGTQPFGDLEILCDRNVLIPRWDTEVYTTLTAEVIKGFLRDWQTRQAEEGVELSLGWRDASTTRERGGCEAEGEKRRTGVEQGKNSRKEKDDVLRIADLCTGSGCIALLLRCLLCGHNDNSNSNSNNGGQQHLSLPDEESLEGPLDKRISITAVDISPHALTLAARNLEHNINLGVLDRSAHDEIRFLHADILEVGKLLEEQQFISPDSIPRESPTSTLASTPYHKYNLTLKSDAIETSPSDNPNFYSIDGDDGTPIQSQPPPFDSRFDVIVSNPPYISPGSFRAGSGTTERSVREHEPALALVPSKVLFPDVELAEQFYLALFHIAIAAETKLLVMEVSDAEQARKVRDLIRRELVRLELGTRRGSKTRVEQEGGVLIETWCDDGRILPSPHPPAYPLPSNDTDVNVNTHDLSRDVGSNTGTGTDMGRTNDENTEPPSERAVVVWWNEWAVWRRRNQRRTGKEART